VLRTPTLCLPNTAPVARLTADVDEGIAPLTVNFSGSDSYDVDTIDSIATYTFNFGDGGDDVTQSSPSIGHTYTAKGEYIARLVVTDSRGKVSSNTAQFKIDVEDATPTPTPTPSPTPTPICLEDNDERIAYSGGWHLINQATASGGHFRYHTGNNPSHGASLDFTVPQGSSGSVSYSFAKSPKGGQAAIYLDGVFQQTINYGGSVGTTQAPEFKPEYKVQYTGLAGGNHKLEIKNMTGVVYVDGFCLESAGSNAQPVSGPGSTTNSSGGAAAGQTSSSNYQPQAGSEEMTVTVESSLGVPFKVVLVDPSGLTLQAVDAISGIATVNAPVNQQGMYVIKVVNVSLGPIQFTTTTTPLVRRSATNALFTPGRSYSNDFLATLDFLQTDNIDCRSAPGADLLRVGDCGLMWRRLKSD
jgi:PKD repeat protein